MTDHSHLAAVRDSYDTVATTYAVRVPRPSELDPLNRAMLAAFAELVRAGGNRRVADLGCGPGLVTAHLASLGLDAFGIDLSPSMVGIAREGHPGLRFAEGSMTALDVADDELGGILAWYSTHHTPPEELPRVFAEFHRTLAPGGHVLLGGYIGEDEHLSPAEAYGHPVSYRSYFLPLDRLAELLRGAGLVVAARLEQAASGRAKRPDVCIVARKPERP
ncbi:class I SAM-dependent methyltransferase [Streptomyces sp. NPDC001876]|uniref:class I SAM-dependent methyltransferase n=1 Tax=Streptomyces sp. NPDC001876 TaxID=3154402 RepID=UPI00332665C3